MKEIRELLDRHLRQSNMDLVDIIPVPQHGDKMVRLRTLEEAIEDFSDGYFIQIRRSPPAQVSQEPRRGDSKGDISEIYLADGKLNIPFLSGNAELLLGVGEITLARNIFKAILATGERTGLALFGVARCDELEGRLEEARANYEESIAYHPTFQTYQRLSALLIGQKKDQLGAEVIERSLNLKDLEPATRYDLHKASGNCWMRAQNHEKAEQHYNSALEIDPSADEIRSNLGALCLQSKRTADAKRHFEDAVASNPDNAKALAGLGSCHLSDGEKRRAHDLFAKSLELELNNPSAVFHLVKCAYEIKSYATAARMVEEYIQIAPLNINLLYSLGGLQFHLGRANDARATARKILELNAEHNGARDLLSLIERIEQV